MIYNLPLQSSREFQSFTFGSCLSSLHSDLKGYHYIFVAYAIILVDSYRNRKKRFCDTIQVHNDMQAKKEWVEQEIK